MNTQVKYTNKELAIGLLFEQTKTINEGYRFGIHSFVLKSELGKNYTTKIKKSFYRVDGLEDFVEGKYSKSLEPKDRSSMRMALACASRGKMARIKKIAKRMTEYSKELGGVAETRKMLVEHTGFDFYRNQAMIAARNGLELQYFCNEPHSGGRIATSLNTMKKEERRSLTLISGISNYEMDMKGSYPQMMAHDMGEKGLGDHTKMLENLGEALNATSSDKKERLEIVGKWLNFEQPKLKTDDALLRLCQVPGWENTREYLEQYAIGKWDGKTLQEQLTEMEQSYILGLCRELDARNIPFIYEYDGLSVPQSLVDTVQTIAYSVYLQNFEYVSKELFDTLFVVKSTVPIENTVDSVDEEKEREKGRDICCTTISNTPEQTKPELPKNQNETKNGLKYPRYAKLDALARAECDLIDDFFEDLVQKTN